MKRIALLAAGLLMVSTAATAGPHWDSTTLTIAIENVPKVQAALDKLMNSFGDDLEGNVSLMANVAGGPGTHSIISSFDSRAEREAWLTKFYASDAWDEYLATTAGMTEPGEVSRMNFVKNWGEQNAGSDVFWEMYALDVSDPAAYVAALDELQASDAAQATGAQVYLSSVAAAGFAPATHLISVGYASEAQAEASDAALQASPAFANFQKATSNIATPKGTFLIRTIGAWGADAN